MIEQLVDSAIQNKNMLVQIYKFIQMSIKESSVLVKEKNSSLVWICTIAKPYNEKILL